MQDARRLSSSDGKTHLSGNGAPSTLGAIRTIGVSDFVDGVMEPIHGDTWFAVIEFQSTGARAEALLGYGNWSRVGSKHVRSWVDTQHTEYLLHNNTNTAPTVVKVEDQMELMSKNEMRPVWRRRKDVEDNLEFRTVL